MMPKDSSEITLKYKSFEIRNYPQEPVVFLKDVKEWLQQKQKHNWLKGSLGYEIIEELKDDLK